MRVVVDGHHRAHRRAERAGVGLGEHLPGHGLLDVPEEPLPDARRVGVRVADPGRGHDRDEIDPGVGPDPFGQRLQRGGRIRRRQPVADGGLRGEGARHRDDLVPGRVLVALLRVVPGQRGAREHHDGHHDHLQHEQLAGQAPAGPDAAEPVAVTGCRHDESVSNT